MDLTWNFQRDGRLETQKPTVGEYRYFLEQHHFIINIFTILDLLSFTHQHQFIELKLPFVCIVMVLGSLHIPAVYNAPLFKPADDSLEGQSLPCVVFSHGLGGNRLIYSTYCCELASQGCLVACVEHRYDHQQCHLAFTTIIAKFSTLASNSRYM